MIVQPVVEPMDRFAALVLGPGSPGHNQRVFHQSDDNLVNYRLIQFRVHRGLSAIFTSLYGGGSLITLDTREKDQYICCTLQRVLLTEFSIRVQLSLRQSSPSMSSIKSLLF